MVDLHCPSIDACKAFGIQRKGAAANENSLKFLSGPQFKNTRISEYSGGNTNGTIDEVILEFIGNRPVSIKPQRGEDGIVKMSIDQKDVQNTLYTISVAPQTTDWLKFGFNHEWNEGEGIMSKVLDTVAGLLDSAAGIINVAQNTVNNDSPQPRRKVTLDKQDSYAKTDKVSFKIPFILFSSGHGSKNQGGNGNPIDQWVNDIYAPLMILTAWTHPKRQTGVVTFGGEKGKDGNVVGGTTIDTETGLTTPSPSQQASDSQSSPVGKQADDLQFKGLSFLSSYPGMRVAISEPPSYVKVSHSSGFFQYNACAITSFSYQFEGPWVKADSLLNPDSRIANSDKKLMDITLPMVAKCELEIKVIEKMYADDWISMFENSPILNKVSAGTKSEIVNVIKKPYSSQASGTTTPGNPSTTSN